MTKNELTNVVKSIKLPDYWVAGLDQGYLPYVVWVHQNKPETDEDRAYRRASAEERRTHAAARLAEVRFYPIKLSELIPTKEGVTKQVTEFVKALYDTPREGKHEQSK